MLAQGNQDLRDQPTADQRSRTLRLVHPSPLTMVLWSLVLVRREETVVVVPSMRAGVHVTRSEKSPCDVKSPYRPLQHPSQLHFCPSRRRR